MKLRKDKWRKAICDALRHELSWTHYRMLIKGEL